MSVVTLKERCISCEKCVDICPGDLVFLDSEGIAYLKYPQDCWDCMSCVKICPTAALDTKIPFQLANFGAKLIPNVKEDSIEWVCVDPKGNEERFLIKTREA